MCPDLICAQHGGSREHSREGEGERTSELRSEALCRKQRGTRLRLTSNRDSLLHPQSLQAHITVHIHSIAGLFVQQNLPSTTCMPALAVSSKATRPQIYKCSVPEAARRARLRRHPRRRGRASRARHCYLRFPHRVYGIELGCGILERPEISVTPRTWGCAEGTSATASLPPRPSRPSASERPSDMRARPLLRLKRVDSCSRIDERRSAPLPPAPILQRQRRYSIAVAHTRAATNIFSSFRFFQTAHGDAKGAFMHHLQRKARQWQNYFSACSCECCRAHDSCDV